MASHFSIKTPPSFNKNTDDYAKWRKKFQIWSNVTEAPKTKQGGLLVLTLDDQTQETIFEKMTADDLKMEGATDQILKYLDEMFKKDESISAFEIYEDFELYKRPSHVSMTEFCSEFERKLSKVKSSGTQIAEHVLAYRMLKSANLTDKEEQLVKATINEMTHADMVKQLKKVFNVSVRSTSSELGSGIKKEANDFNIETLYGYNYSPNYDESYPGDEIRIRKGDLKTKKTPRKMVKKIQGRNPIDVFGHIKRCKICESINHLERNCPHYPQQVNNTYYCQVESFLSNSNILSEDELLIGDYHEEEESKKCSHNEDDEIYYEIEFINEKEAFKATGCGESLLEAYNATHQINHIDDESDWNFNVNENEGEHCCSLHFRDQKDDTMKADHDKNCKEDLLTGTDQSVLYEQNIKNKIIENHSEIPRENLVDDVAFNKKKHKIEKSVRLKVKENFLVNRCVKRSYLPMLNCQDKRGEYVCGIFCCEYVVMRNLDKFTLKIRNWKKRKKNLKRRKT